MGAVPAGCFPGAATPNPVVHDDEVDLTNLQRQIIHPTANVGRPKVDSAR
ncbi:ThiF family adenylyltransferase, partial [Cupriavidus necator]